MSSKPSQRVFPSAGAPAGGVAAPGSAHSITIPREVVRSIRSGRSIGGHTVKSAKSKALMPLLSLGTFTTVGGNDAASAAAGARDAPHVAKPMPLAYFLELSDTKQNTVLQLARSMAAGEDVSHRVPEWLRRAVGFDLDNLLIVAVDMMEALASGIEVEDLGSESIRVLVDVEDGNVDIDAALWDTCFDFKVDLQLVKVLVAYGADVDTVGNFGWHPLHMAAMRGNTELVSLLVRCGADLDAQCAAAYTPLHYAAMWGFDDAALLLRSLGASLLLHNRACHTPIDLARLAHNDTLHSKLLRAVPIREEALFRMRFLYTSLFSGAEEWWTPDVEQRSPYYNALSLVMLVLWSRPFFFTSKKKTQFLAPYTLETPKKLGTIVFGAGNWEAKLACFDAADAKLATFVSTVIFNKDLSPAQVADGLANGRRVYSDVVKERERRLRLAAARTAFIALLKWSRNEDPLHRSMLWDMVQEHLETMSAVARVRAEEWLTGGDISMEEFLTWHDEERSIVEAIHRVYEQRKGALLGTKDSRRQVRKVQGMILNQHKLEEKRQRENELMKQRLEEWEARREAFNAEFKPDTGGKPPVGDVVLAEARSVRL